MATATTVTYGVDTPAAAPRAGVSVTAELIGAGDRADDIGVVTGSVTATTGVEGTFTLALLPNSAYAQVGTYYAVNIAGGPSYTIVVPVAEDPVDLIDLVIDPRTLDPVPAAAAPAYLLRTERGSLTGVAPLVAGKVPALYLPSSSGGSPTIGDVIGLQDALDAKEDDGVAQTLLNVHLGATDPHPQYLTAAEGTAVFDPLGAAAAVNTTLTTHLNGTDPHPQYLTSTEGDAAYVRLALVDAKGDLVVATGADAVTRLAVGSDGQVLTADAAQPAGVKWATPAAGGGSGELEIYGPAGAGFDEWTCDPILCSSNFPTASGTLLLIRHRFRKAMTVDEIGFVLQQAGTVPGSYSGVAIYADGTGSVARQAQSADAGASFTSTGAKSLALTAGHAVAAGDFRWIGYLWQGSTPPRLYAPPGPADSAMFNVGRRRSVFLAGQTAFPASLDVSAMTVNTTHYWFSFRDVP